MARAKFKPKTPEEWTREREQKAMEIAASRIKLRARLRETQSCLSREYKSLFGKHAVFDFENRRLISDCGRYALQWELRRYPDEPESYNNQQTTAGGVYFAWMSDLLKKLKEQAEHGQKAITPAVGRRQRRHASAKTGLDEACGFGG